MEERTHMLQPWWGPKPPVNLRHPRDGSFTARPLRDFAGWSSFGGPLLLAGCTLLGLSCRRAQSPATQVIPTNSVAVVAGAVITSAALQAELLRRVSRGPGGATE